MAGAASYNSRWQMNCCIACGGPFAPSREVLRKDRVGSRSLNYLEAQVVSETGEWDVDPRYKVNLVSAQENLHMVHRTNSIPVLDAWLTGALRNTWGGDPSPMPAAPMPPAGYPNNTILVPLVPAGVEFYYITVPRGNGSRQVNHRWVMWDPPDPIDNLDPLRDLIELCVRRSSFRVGGVLRARLVPPTNITVPGCAECNQIMTQESNMRHLLARNVLHVDCLVPLDSIIRYNLSDDGARTRGPMARDPNVGNRSGIYFSYQATIAYYIHRCMPARAVPARIRHAREAARGLHVFFAYFMLEILSLQCERYFGREGGAAMRRKPAYRYKGLIELYLSFMFWLLLSNDVAYNEPENGNGRSVGISFVHFHRYWFSEILDTLMVSHNQAAGAVEISDLIFSGRFFAAGAAALAPGGNNRMERPDQIIGYMAQCIANFYTNLLRPHFSRHMAGLDPLVNDPNPVLPVAQRIVLARLITRDNMNVLMHILERASLMDVDSYMNHVGVHAVLSVWRDRLRTAPNKANKLLDKWIETWTLHEYDNIIQFLRQNPALPRLSAAVAESIYLMCNVMDLPTEPTNQEELNVLRAAPKCSPYKAALRLELTGAFQDDE